MVRAVVAGGEHHGDAALGRVVHGVNDARVFLQVERDVDHRNAELGRLADRLDDRPDIALARRMAAFRAAGEVVDAKGDDGDRLLRRPQQDRRHHRAVIVARLEGRAAGLHRHVVFGDESAADLGGAGDAAIDDRHDRTADRGLRRWRSGNGSYRLERR
jgi:hypothetical protein